MLPPGHTMTVSADGTIRTERYWPPASFPLAPAGGAVAEVRRQLERAVEEHLLADVPVASFLSGGIDSSVVTALAARHTTGRLQTFSVGFSHKQFDETEIAARVAGLYGTDHHRIELSDAEVIQLVQDAVAKMDLPSVDAINTYIVARKVAEAGIKVALSGLGGDELFGGYPSFADVPRLKWLALLPAPLRRILRLAGATGRRLADLPDGDVSTLTAWRRRTWTDAMQRAAGLPLVAVDAEPPPALPDDFARISWAELTGYMRHMLLRDSDQMSMAVSLELRVPFLDHELASYVLSLPRREKARPGRPKSLLIEACRDLLPREVHDRSKMGFVLPMAQWMRGPLAAFVDDGLRTVVEREYLSRDLVKEMHDAFCCGKLQWARVWALVVAGHYLRRHGQEVTA
jgi:asparagine synthase (glutamine-hydrolysing)